MARALVVVLLGGLGFATCEKNIARPPVEEVPMRDPQELAPPTPPAASVPAKPEPAVSSTTPPPLTATTATTRDEPAEPPRDRAFPKQADACKKDDDCAATTLVMGGESLCCTPCKAVAGTKAWVRRVEQVCQQKTKAGLKPRCGAPWDCNKPETECRLGKCQVK
jgi:hypothetical protein